MVAALPFEDIPPDEKIEFLASAHRYGVEQTGSERASEVAERSGLATSAIRFYERQGLVHAERTPGGQRRFRRDVLRRIAFVRIAQRVGLTLEEIAAALAVLPVDRAPTRRDWERLTAGWQARIEQRISLLEALQGGLSGCIGCGCLSLRT